jgi:hypothetical protein
MSMDQHVAGASGRPEAKREAGSRRSPVQLIASVLVLLLTAGIAGSVHAARAVPDNVNLRNPYRLQHKRHAAAHGALQRAADPVAENFDVLGHSRLGADASYGDVWVHGDFAYVGTWASPCTGSGVRIVDVSDPTAPGLVGSLAARRGTSAEDVVVRSVSTPSFTGDLLGVGIQRCGRARSLDRARFGLQLWDVTDPTTPDKLGTLGLTTGGGGVHELDLMQRGADVYVAGATPFSEWFDPNPAGDFRIVDVTNPANPTQVGQWGAGAHDLSAGPYHGMGSFGASYGHSARFSEDGTKVFVSYWDLGVLTLDITDVTDPVLVERTEYGPKADGDAHSLSEYGDFLLQNDEDFDSRSPADIIYGPGPSKRIATESPGGTPLWRKPGHRLRDGVVKAERQGCHLSDYPRRAEGRIVVVRTLFPFFDPGGGKRPACGHGVQAERAEKAGAVALVHDFISSATSPQWFQVRSVNIPVLFTDHRTARGMVAAGAATLRAGEPSWGFLRVFDAATGEQVAKFDGVANVHRLRSPKGDWTVHNNEILGDRSYVSWYSNGVVALDLSPLGGTTPSDPVKVGQFVPPGARSRSDALPNKVPIVWGVAARQSDGILFVSDMNGGLWIVEPTGPAAPSP